MSERRPCSVVNATGGSGLAGGKVLGVQGAGESDDALELPCRSDARHGLRSKGKTILLSPRSRSFSSRLRENTPWLVLSHPWLGEFSLRRGEGKGKAPFGQGSSPFSFSFGIFILKARN